MSTGLVLFAEQHVNAPPEHVFDLFGAGSGAGWLFDANCDRVAAGSVVTLSAPIGGPGTTPVDILGRISAVKSPLRIEIVHEQPWRGRLRVLFDRADGGRCRLRLFAELDEVGLAWLMRRRGSPVAESVRPDEHLVGLLTSKSGPGGVFAAATENLAAMAVAEVNADGGIRRRPVHLVVGDDATDPGTGVREAQRLVRAGCRTIIATTTSATFARVAAALSATGVLLVHSLMNEGGLAAPLRVQLGERPHRQLRAAVGPMMRLAGGTRWFLAGNDYCWPWAVHAAAWQVVNEKAGTVVGEAFAPLGSRDFGPLIDRVLAARPDVVLSSFVGADLVAFERQCFARGVREQSRSLALALDEPTRERIGDQACVGMWGVSGYFEQLDVEENRELLRRYRGAYGPFATPVSSISELVYEAVHLYVTAARRVGTDDPAQVARELRRGRVDDSRGTVSRAAAGETSQQLYLAEAVAGGFSILPATGHVSPR
jgi:branched-chain amino acid transport system substrate-binding protein